MPTKKIKSKTKTKTRKPTKRGKRMSNSRKKAQSSRITKRRTRSRTRKQTNRVPKRVTRAQTRKRTTRTKLVTPITIPTPISFTPSYWHADYLVGPVELTILDHPDGRRIVLLGDVHTQESRCVLHAKKGARSIRIVEYLEALFSTYTGTEPIDFFLEEHYFESDNSRVIPFKSTNNYLLQLRGYYNNCLKRLKTKCQFDKNKVRFHYADVRTGVIQSKTPSDQAVIIREFQRVYENRNLTRNDYKFLQTLIQKFLQKDRDYFFHLSKVDKQLAKLPIEQRAIFNQYMDNDMNDQETTISMLNNQLNKSLEKNTVEDLAELNVATFIVGIMLSSIFDIYTMARLLNPKANMRKVIIYAGQAHTEKITEYMTRHFGFSTTVHKSTMANRKTGKPFQCIDMKGVPQPWFQ